MSLREIIKVNCEKLKRDAYVLSKDKIILHPHNVVFVFRIIVLQVLKDFYLNSCLMMKLLLVSHDLHGNVFIVLVVKALQALSKAARAQRACYLVPVCNVIFEDSIVIPFIIVIPEVVF